MNLSNPAVAVCSATAGFFIVKRQPHAKRGDKKLKLWTEKVSNDKIEVATNRNKKSKENPWMN